MRQESGECSQEGGHGSSEDRHTELIEAVNGENTGLPRCLPRKPAIPESAWMDGRPNCDVSMHPSQLARDLSRVAPQSEPISWEERRGPRFAPPEENMEALACLLDARLIGNVAVVREPLLKEFFVVKVQGKQISIARHRAQVPRSLLKPDIQFLFRR